MKKTFFLLAGFIAQTTLLFAQPGILPINRPMGRKIQVAVLFDASNSMDGLLDQAKSRLWNIVNELSTLRAEGQIPTIEISLYKYGHDDLSSGSNYVQQLVPLTTDLDLISKNLFGITTNGGSEYCGAVISASLGELNWSQNPTDLKMIYIAGNEPFNQGTVFYKTVCSTAASRNIFVNTIYCGPYDQGVKEFWYDGAQIGKGDYFNIDANKEVVHIDTPYDQKINAYNDSLNHTYIGYGNQGIERKVAQEKEDQNAIIQSPSAITERSIVKSKKVYNNASWDIVDAEIEGKDITKLANDELPDELKNKTDEEKKAFIEKKKSEREAYQAQIAQLAKDRQAFIETELKKKSAQGQADDFGTSVNTSILKKGESIGFVKEK